MKLGLISDIHADLNSLQLALAVLHDQHVDQILCAGDVVEKGLYGNAVVRLLQAENVLSVAGNHDRQALANDKWHIDYIESDPARPSYFLDNQSVDWLQQLPQTLDFNIDDIRLCVAHGTPVNDLLYVFPTSRRRVFEKVVQQANANIVILGHSHTPMLVCIDDTWICNPGSVCGALSSGSGTCATLNLPHCQFNFFDITTGMRVMPHHAELGESR